MLSDPQSRVIREFGILNTLIAEDDHPWFGIPFPGTYVVDADGIIGSKFFENHLALRPGADQLARAVRGEAVELEAATASQEVGCSVSIDRDPIAPGVLRELIVSLRVPQGQHLYGEPVPAGMVATAVEIDQADELVILDATLPATRTHVLRGTGEELQVYDGDVSIRIPFTHSAPLTSLADKAARPTHLSVSGTVRWQACDDEACRLPSSTRFQFELPLGLINRPGRAEQGGMDTKALLRAMVDRRSD